MQDPRTPIGYCACGCGNPVFKDSKGRSPKFINHHCDRTKKGNLPELFWAKANKSSNCWTWMGNRDKHGYGRVGKKKVVAHRIAWILTNGPIPPGMKVLHSCDNPPCCNPAHLFLGTQLDNMRDCQQKGRYGHTGVTGDRHGSRTHPEAIKYGETLPQAKLTEASVHLIRQLIANGESQTSISRRFHVSQACISKVARGLNWRHIS